MKKPNLRILAALSEPFENLVAAGMVLWALSQISHALAVGVAGAAVLTFNLFRRRRGN